MCWYLNLKCVDVQFQYTIYNTNKKFEIDSQRQGKEITLNFAP